MQIVSQNEICWVQISLARLGYCEFKCMHGSRMRSISSSVLWIQVRQSVYKWDCEIHTLLINQYIKCRFLIWEQNEKGTWFQIIQAFAAWHAQRIAKERTQIDAWLASDRSEADKQYCIGILEHLKDTCTVYGFDTRSYLLIFEEKYPTSGTTEGHPMPRSRK